MGDERLTCPTCGQPTYDQEEIRRAEIALARVRSLLMEVPEGKDLDWSQIAYLKETVGDDQKSRCKDESRKKGI